MPITKFVPNERGQCPHCLTVVRFEPAEERLGSSQVKSITGRIVRVWSTEILCSHCPDCGHLIFSVCKVIFHTHEGLPGGSAEFGEQILLWPLHRSRVPPPQNVPDPIKEDYNEAALVLMLSPKASAALSRRCLQALLRRATIKKISGSRSTRHYHIFPVISLQMLTLIRQVGNFAAHPMKSTSSGEIVDIEHGEAEWNLDVLDMLFDFYYTQPAIAQQKRDALNAKLVDAGKKPMK